MYTDRSYRSNASGPYGLLPVDHQNVAYMYASGAPSSACELRWTSETVANVEAVVVRLLLATTAGLAPTIMPALACNTSQ